MVEIGPGDRAHGSPKPKGGARPGAGRIRKSRLLSTNKFRELCIKHGPEALGIIMDIARSGEPDAARFLAAKFIIERGYGLPDGENPGGGVTVNVVSGVHDRGPDEALRPLLPDGRDPFEQPPPPSSGRPVGRAPVVEPPSAVRLTGGRGKSLPHRLHSNTNGINSYVRKLGLWPHKTPCFVFPFGLIFAP